MNDTDTDWSRITLTEKYSDLTGLTTYCRTYYGVGDKRTKVVKEEVVSQQEFGEALLKSDLEWHRKWGEHALSGKAYTTADGMKWTQ